MTFDDIRPYTDAEIPEALRRITEWSDFQQAIRFIYPDGDISQIKKNLLGITSVHQLQATLMNDAIRRIIATTTDGFTYSGLHNLRRGAAYLFVSNHRDITLDAFLLQHLLLEHKGDTSHIVFGDNLLSLPIMTDLFRSNKLIQMPRGGNPRAFYNSLHHLSEYLTDLVTVQHQSVWIAQKNGRAKDGVDTTAPAMIKMLTLGGGKDAMQTLANLHIVPVSISYEWDPCDTMKATELYLSRQGSYQKAKDEDLKSVVMGIIGPKGHVHLNIGVPLKPAELNPGNGLTLAEHVATLLDKRIRKGYQLMPTNYIAHSLLTGKEMHGRFTQRDKKLFLARLDTIANPEVRQIMLETYAAPVAPIKTN
ncbi:MAG: 1-acyl-sn-glycerol-3-phosphate acyltransferase [Bacteroidales bacterium]|nr:1-acyl-sn-glycerol-3-phosphate acyltransferase [Bacteroidales bacterium]